MSKLYWYKAVHKETEESVCWSLRGNSTTAQKLGRVYRNGMIVSADPRTIGCFLFKRMKDAVEFVETSDNWKLKRVIPLAPCKKLQTDEIFGATFFDSYNLDYVFNCFKQLLKGEINVEYTQETPYGTYTCMKLKVIEDVPIKDFEY